ncbi:MAG: hypothetical protein MUF72_04750 [Elainella sp. Prado103]|nr:hypothetical protein [Elainella sp. Prado103]
MALACKRSWITTSLALDRLGETTCHDNPASGKPLRQANRYVRQTVTSGKPLRQANRYVRQTATD